MDNLRSTVIMKTDLADFTSRVSKASQSDLAHMLNVQKDLVSVVVSKNSGSIVKGEGDSFWITFPSVTTAAVSAVEIQQEFQIAQAGFSEEDTADLDISILTEETLEMLKYEGNYFARAYGKNPDSILYDSDFIWPCSGTITTLFGTPRRYNEDLDKWSHKAVDIANVVGTKVYAPNHGLVVMAKNLEVHGKSIVIAHGQKIHTIYIHLDSLCVEKGDKIKKGQYIGRLGRTGLCTGPNLHWGFVVNRVHVDPRYWIKGNPEIKKGQWIQYKKPED